MLCRQASWDQQQQQQQQPGLESVRGGAASYLLLVGCRQCCAACGIFIPQLGPQPAVETRSPNHWTTRDICSLASCPERLWLHFWGFALSCQESAFVWAYPEAKPRDEDTGAKGVFGR